MAEEANAPDDGSGIFELDEDQVIERLAELLLPVEAEHSSDRRHDADADLQMRKVNDLGNLDELVAVLPEDADQDQAVPLLLSSRSGQIPRENDARERVRKWLDERSPACPATTRIAGWRRLELPV